MHIPKNSTEELNIKSFDSALLDYHNHKHDYSDECWLFVPDTYDEYRYILGRKGNKPLIVIGINPSTAQPDDLDNTLKSVDRISSCNGYDSWMMFNVYAQRATVPDDMDRVLNPKLHSENLKAFDYLLRLSPRPSIWASWGAIIEKRDYLIRCVCDLYDLSKKYDASWFICGPVSKSGHPHHPLYLKKDSPLVQFDIENYIRSHRV